MKQIWKDQPVLVPLRSSASVWITRLCGWIWIPALLQEQVQLVSCVRVVCLVLHAWEGGHQRILGPDVQVVVQLPVDLSYFACRVEQTLRGTGAKRDTISSVRGTQSGLRKLIFPARSCKNSTSQSLVQSAEHIQQQKPSSVQGGCCLAFVATVEAVVSPRQR